MKLTAIFDGMRGGVNRHFYVEKKPMKWFILNSSDDLKNIKKIPVELQYSLAIHPSRYKVLETLLNEGHGIALGKQNHIPLEVLEAVRNIANTHHGAIYPWLEDLVIKQAIPRWSESDFEEAMDEGIDLKKQAEIINDHIANSIQIKLVKSSNTLSGNDPAPLLRAMEADIQKIFSLEVASKLLSEHLNRSRDISFLIVLSIVLFAPVVQILSSLVSGLGKFTAIVLPALYHESLRVKQSYSLGAASWQLIDGVKAKWPELIIMLPSAIAVQFLLDQGLVIVSGICFFIGSSAVFTGVEIRRLKKSRQVYSALVDQGKFQMVSKTAWLKLFYGPVWWVHGLSLVLSLISIVVIFANLTPTLSNGWILSLMAVSSLGFYEILLLTWQLTLKWRFKNKIKNMLSQAIIS
jgi:hypothetical protein